MAGLVDTLFGPLQKEYCLWFLFLSALGLIWLFFYIISAFYIGVMKKKGFDYFITVFSVGIAYFIFYFQNRLLYTMCNK